MPRITHGMHGTPEYRAWEHMKHRCFNPNNPQFKDYGGRGITVCPAWLTFEGFYADMGLRPPGLTLERDDNDRGYEPSNCRWASRREQGNNRRTNRLVEYQGETLSMTVWAERFGISRDCMKVRLDNGWTMQEIATTPVSKTNSVRRKRQTI